MKLSSKNRLPGDVVVSAHTCGGLTDMILARAVGARARVAVLPCCHYPQEPPAHGGAWFVSPPGSMAIRQLMLDFGNPSSMIPGLQTNTSSSSETFPVFHSGN